MHLKKKYSIFLISSLLILFNGCHIGRYFIYNFANITDYKKFQERTISTNPENTYNFSRAIDARSMITPHTANRYESVEELETFLEDSKSVAFMVIHNDTIKYEWFADKWSNDDLVTSFSMSKSVISALIGIALNEGYIKNLDDPITDYIKIFKNEGFDKITVQHLLDMRTGIDYNESYYNPFGNVAIGYYGRNLDRHISNLKIKGPPGEEFEYISIATQLLGNIIEEATGQSVSSYMQEKIWSKIGTEFDASWSMDRKKGREKSFCCINAHAEDFAKFARLYLHLGKWEGEQIIPEDWIKQSIQIQKDTEDNFYQNQWWLFGPSDPKQPELVTYAAQGHLGQVMAIDPTKNLIIIRFGKQWGKTNWLSFFKSLAKSF
ncbi:MAG: serine hydrolase [Flavobacteriales bacterium]|nr:serine hydrolase [Flavobacteriales bacterium]MCB9198009.1 serine hydrolase [Flavobacteriales bacterium]